MAQTRVRIRVALRLDFALEELSVTGRAFEGAETRLNVPPRRTRVAQTRGGHPGETAEQPSQEEGAEPRAASATVHALDCRLTAVYVCTLGDLLLDVVVRLDEPMAEDTDAYGRIRVTPGGQAANVAAWAAALGARARLIAAHARDAAGRLLQDELRARGVELSGCELAEGTGTVVSVATPDGSRSMLTDRGIAQELPRSSLRRPTS